MVRYLLLVGVGVVVLLFIMALLRQVLGPGAMMLLYIALIIPAIYVVIRNLRSNRKVTDATAEQVAHALTFTPEPGKAVLYVWRKQFVGMAVGVNLRIDGVDVAQIKSPRFTRVLLRPGSHQLGGFIGGAKAPKAGSELALNAEAGSVMFALCEVEPQMVGSIVKFRAIPVEQARQEMHKARMVVPDVAEV